MLLKRAFISFDHDHDEGAKILLVGQAKHLDSPFEVTNLAFDWKGIDVVIVLCGEWTHLAKGVALELSQAREKNKQYFLLAAYTDKNCRKPTSALGSDKVYQWTWDNLKELVDGVR